MPVANRILEIAGRLDNNVFRKPGDAEQKSCQTKYYFFIVMDLTSTNIHKFPECGAGQTKFRDI